jgi:hypothetical protein
MLSVCPCDPSLLFTLKINVGHIAMNIGCVLIFLLSSDEEGCPVVQMPDLYHQLELRPPDSLAIGQEIQKHLGFPAFGHRRC